MRSTRQKLKLLRGVSRASSNGGNSSRKSSNGNHHPHNHNCNQRTNHDQQNLQQLHNHHSHSNHKHNNQSSALSQHNNQFFISTTSSTTTNIPSNNHTSHFDHNNHTAIQNSQQQFEGLVGRAGSVRKHSTSSSSSSSSYPLSFGESYSVNNNNNNNKTSSLNPVPQSASSSPEVNLEVNSSSNPFISTPGTHHIGTGHPSRQWTQFLTTNMDCTGLNSDIREKAWGICRDYLHGAWKQLDSKDLVIKRVSGGLSNWLYHCSLPLTLTPQHNEPHQVLLRFYGQVHGEGALESLITESVIFTLLSERKLGPRLYGVFPGGRVEEFIPARPLQTPELRDPELSLLIAQKTAQIHGLNIPISKEPSWLWGTMERWMSNVRECFMRGPDMNECKPEVLKTLIDYNLEGELEWLRMYLPTIKSPVVFAHNDLQEGNILIRPDYESQDEKLALIDFEYCSYNYRGFDLANHFCEWSYNYNIEAYPNFAFTPGDLPSKEEKLRFIRRYVTILREEYKLNFTDFDDEFLRTSPLFDEEHIMREVEVFTLASHFFWSLWAIVNAQVSKIPFGYWEYGLCRLDSYFNLKKTFV